MLNAVKKLCRKGFTLLELLVVVLIIGILAAIALPQYQFAVDKTQFAKLQSTAKEIADAYTRYHLITNDYPNDIKQLDIDFSDENQITYPTTGVSCVVFGDYYCCLAQVRKNVSYGDTMCGNLDYSFYYVHRLFLDDGSQSNYRDCRAKADNTKAVRVCSDFSQKKYDTGTSAILTPYGTKSGYTAYHNNRK